MDPAETEASTPAPLRIKGRGSPALLLRLDSSNEKPIAVPLRHPPTRGRSGAETNLAPSKTLAARGHRAGRSEDRRYEGEKQIPRPPKCGGFGMTRVAGAVGEGERTQRGTVLGRRH